jgi:hypothetical protein
MRRMIGEGGEKRGWAGSNFHREGGFKRIGECVAVRSLVRTFCVGRERIGKIGMGRNL